MRPLLKTRDERLPDGHGGDCLVEVYGNERYTVLRRVQEPVEEGAARLIWLSLHTHDRQALQDWRELQQIKNQLIGPECEAVQLYPAESRLVDTSNEAHVWGVDDPTFRFPFGYHERLVAEGPYTNGAKQRPFAPGERPVDCLAADELERRSRDAGIGDQDT